METETKPVSQSKTIWGIAITVVSALLPLAGSWLGYDVTAEDTTTIVEALTAVGVAVGAALAVYGRIKATKTIG